MDKILAIDPNTFQSQVLAWIGVLTVIAGALSGFVALLISYFNKLKATAVAEQAKAAASVAAEKATVANARIDRQSDKIEGLRSDITNVALAVPAASGVPQPVEVVNTESTPVPTSETTKKPTK